MQALEHGLVLRKINAVISYDQKAWMKPYIEQNTNYRAKAKNEFEKNFFKLMNNSVFGKTIENVRNRSNIFITNNETELIKHQTKPTFLRATAFNQSLVAIHHMKLSILYNKPMYVGAQILDISKTLMYKYHYDYFKPKFNPKLLMSDTDALAYHIHTDDVYKDIADDCEKYFDTSAQKDTRNGNLPLGLNKKVVGLLKDEAGDNTISEFVGLRPKLYSFMSSKAAKETETKRAKGVKKAVINKTITFNDYVNVLTTNESEERKMMLFFNKNHTIYTIEQNKVALDANDDKRHILPNRISTLALGHYKIYNNNNAAASNDV